jgi:DNA-binding NtrC family response regulator
LIQGYYFSKPLPEEDFTQLLREGGRYNLEEIHGKNTQLTLLIIDDEESVRAALMRAFRRDGYHILTAGSANEAFDLLARNEVGVIISDQRMPGMTGSEFLSRVRSMYPETVRIILSGYADLNAVIDGINNGAIYKFLIKPWDDNLLRENIREAFKYYSFTRSSRKPQE